MAPSVPPRRPKVADVEASSVKIPITKAATRKVIAKKGFGIRTVGAEPAVVRTMAEDRRAIVCLGPLTQGEEDAGDRKQTQQKCFHDQRF